jgi:hypothetical protein
VNLHSGQVYTWKAFKQSVLCFDRRGRKKLVGTLQTEGQNPVEINNDDSFWLFYFVTYFMQEAFLD